MKTQVELIYQEISRIATKNAVVINSITRKVTSPQFMMEFSNGSTIRFFTSGMRSGGKSDVARGQEAHVIVLDEMDYMHVDDLDALYAMLQKTSEDQEDKMMIGASTPTGRREKFWEWCRSERFQEFWFPSYCFDRATLITMADGSFKEIHLIEKDDYVLTESGSQKVLKIFERDFVGDIYKIKTYGDNTEVIVTGEHPFSTAKRVRRQKIYNWEWVKVRNLELSKWRNTNSGDLIRSIIDVEEKEFNIDLLEIFKNILFENKPGRVQLVKNEKKGRKIVNDFPRYISSKNEDLAILIGWYLAEGHLEAKDKEGNYRAAGWTLNSKEDEFIDLIEESLNNLSAGTLSRTYRKDHNAVCLRVTNAPLALLLDYLCGRNSLEKQIHPILMKAPIKFQEKMILSYADGDGYVNKGLNIIFRTSSRILAKQTQTICARINGFLPSISANEEAERIISKKYLAYKMAKSYAVDWDVSGKKTMLGKKKIDNQSYALLLSGKTTTQYEGTVYNFEVENTNSYIANGLLVHNCNPFFSKEQEDEFREQYTEMGYRHEIEADWGEDSEGVYPRKYVDKAFIEPSWDYNAEITSARSFHIIGVDWDKYGAGTNIVIVEVCAENYEDERFRGKCRVSYREEIDKSEYTLTKAVDRIIQLNEIFKPRHIYVDRGFGEVQVELLHKYGVENPRSNLRERVKGVSFAESVEVRDPYTKMLIKKEMKPYMVDNVRQFLEKERILCSQSDEELYMQLISYIVIRTTQTGRPIFEASGSAMDHAHDALMLALLAVTQNYGEFSMTNYATKTETFSNDFYMPNTKTVKDEDVEPKYAIIGRAAKLSPAKFTRKSSSGKKNSRKMF